jgi:Icc-related predicted phosphoesterase
MLDEVGGANVGCRSIRKYLKDFDLVCCGHIHDQTGVVEEDGTVIVNPGPASEGKCAIIILGEEAKDIQVDLIQL